MSTFRRGLVLGMVTTFAVAAIAWAAVLAHAETMTVSPGARLMFAQSYTSNASGVSAVASMDCGLKWFVQPTTAGEFANQITCAGGTVTVTFRKFKPAGLGITLGTLPVEIFEASSGVVTYNLFGVAS